MSAGKKITRAVLIVVVLFAAVAAAFLIFRKPKKLKYKSSAVTRGEILSQVSATGTINPIRKVTVGSQVSGIVDTVLVDYNDFVRAGQVLARIDPRNYNAALLQSSANLTSAQLSLAQAERTWRNAESLAASQLISDDQLFQAKTDYELARTRVIQAQANYEQAQTNLAYTTITSPMSGQVIARKVQNGQTVAASFSAPELFNIADLSQMQVEVSIQEADVGKLDTGMQATCKVDAYSDKSFDGKLVQIRNDPVVSQNVVTYVGIIQVANPDFLLKPGMTADVKIEITHVADVLVVPSSALNPKLASLLGLTPARTGAAGRGPGAGSTATVGRPSSGNASPPPAGGSSERMAGHRRPRGDSAAALPEGGIKTQTVYVLEKGKPVPRQVGVGANDSYNTEIRSGLTEGELVVTGLDQAKVNPFTQQGRGPGGFH